MKYIDINEKDIIVELNTNDIVFEDNDIAIIKKDGYKWYKNTISTESDLILWCRASYQIEHLKLADKGYPIHEIISEEELIRDCKSVDDVRRLKENHSIKWHDVTWNTGSAFTGGPSYEATSQVIGLKNGAPERAPKYVLSDGYYRHGEHFHFEENIK